jgi:hypothetical protein
MKKIDWKNVGNFVMGVIGVAVGLLVLYTMGIIVIAILNAIYVVLIK